MISYWRSKWSLFVKKVASHKNALWQVWLNLAQWFWRRFLNFVNLFSLFRNYPPLGKGCGPSFEQIWINFNPLHLGMLCTKFSWIWPSGSGEEEGNVNSLHRRWLRRWWTMDKMWSVKLTCSGELKSVQKRRCWPVNVMLVCSIRC